VDDSNGTKNRQILSIENVTQEDVGQYSCLVKNKYGSATQSAWLILGSIFYTWNVSSCSSFYKCVFVFMQ